MNSISRAVSFYNKSEDIGLNIDDVSDGIFINSIDGIYSFEGNVSTSDYSQTHGARYKSTRVPFRNIVVNGQIYKDFNEYRQILYKVFRPDAQGEFTYFEDEKDARIANYYVEKVDIAQEHNISTFQVSLICPDPFFYNKNNIVVELAAWSSDFTFPHEFREEGEELGHRMTSMIEEIDNLNGVSGIGMEITLTATGDVINPYVYLYETGESINIGTDLNPYTLTSAKKVVINTSTGSKGIKQIIDNSELNINEYLDPESVFFQLDSGINTIGYNASSGAEYLDVRIEYRMRYLGV